MTCEREMNKIEGEKATLMFKGIIEKMNLILYC